LSGSNSRADLCFFYDNVEMGMLRLCVVSLALASITLPASAHHRQSSHHYQRVSALAHGHRHGHGRAWCGAYMRHVFGIADPGLNLARNWARQGSNAGGPQVGAVVVWPHHVGVIRGGPDSSGQWLIESGNDGNAVRTRYRSIRGAIAFRNVSGGGFASAEAYSPPRARTARSAWPDQFAQTPAGYQGYAAGDEGYSAGYMGYAPAGKRRYAHRMSSRRYSLL
jgi:hypothetical protein